MTKRRISKKKVTIFIVIVLVIVGAIVGGYFYFNQNDDVVTKVKKENTDTIEGYDYVLSENATKYYKKLFKQLKEVLEQDEVSESNYADLVTKLFVADFYNLDNKISKNDVGGTQFVYEDFRNDFEALAKSSMYKNVKNNIEGTRDQDLPIVNNVSTLAKENTSFEYGENVDNNAFVISFTIEYDSDLGYQTDGIITLIHNGKKLEIASLEEDNEN